MKTNLAYDNSNLKARIDDELYIFSIRRIVSDILLKEMKTGETVKVIAIVGSFRSDKSNEIANHISYEFADQGNNTLLLSLQKERIAEEGKNRICELNDYGIMKTHVKRLDFLSVDNLSRLKDFNLNKASLCALLDTFKEKYKRIVIDAPPLEEDLSGFMSAIAASGIYYVLNSRSIHTREVQKHYADLKALGANVFGIIYNNAETRIVKKFYKIREKKHG